MAQETGGIRREEHKEDSAALATTTGGALTEEQSRTATTTAVDQTIHRSEDSEHIRAKIDETRSEMGGTLDEIQERLSVQNISDQVSEQVNSAIESVKTTAYDATIAKAVNFMKETGDEFRHTAVGRTVMQNPIPFVLIGAGTAMLLMNLKGKGTARAEYLGRSAQSGNRRALTSSGAGSVKTTIEGTSGEGVMDKAKHTYDNAYDSVSGAAGSAYDSVAGVADSAYSGAAGFVGKAKDRAGDLGHTVQENYEYYAEEKPLALAAAAVAVGAAIGFAIPSSRYESDMMGETRDNLWNKAEATAGDLVDQAKEAASNVGEAASKELGLSEGGAEGKSGSSMGSQKGQSGAGGQKGPTGSSTSGSSPSGSTPNQPATGQPKR